MSDADRLINMILIAVSPPEEIDVSLRPVIAEHLGDRRFDLVAFGNLLMDLKALGVSLSEPEMVGKFVDRVCDRYDEDNWEGRRAARAARYAEESVVYYLTLPGNMIKIGTTVNMKARLSGLRVGQDAVLATEPGDGKLERMRHKQFADLRIGRLENFRPAPELMSHIEMVVKHFGPPKFTDHLPASRTA